MKTIEQDHNINLLYVYNIYMINITKHLKYTLVLYIFISIYLWQLKPKIMFNQSDKTMKTFGLGRNKTILYYPIVIIIIAILIYTFLINYF